MYYHLFFSIVWCGIILNCATLFVITIFYYIISNFYFLFIFECETLFVKLPFCNCIVWYSMVLYAIAWHCVVLYRVISYNMFDNCITFNYFFDCIDYYIMVSLLLYRC